MSEQVQRRRVVPDDQRQEVVASPQVRPMDVDAILDEIDAVLLADAEDYVRGFVQKGGQ